MSEVSLLYDFSSGKSIRLFMVTLAMTVTNPNKKRAIHGAYPWGIEPGWADGAANYGGPEMIMGRTI